jgi:hypothetical protein
MGKGRRRNKNSKSFFFSAREPKKEKKDKQKKTRTLVPMTGPWGEYDDEDLLVMYYGGMYSRTSSKAIEALSEEVFGGTYFCMSEL